MKDKKMRQLRRKNRIRARIKKSGLPRLSVFRSNKHIYAQIIDDKAGKTLVAASDLNLDSKLKEKKTKTQKAQLVGEKIAQLALKQKIKKVVFDRGCYLYHGRVKALAEAARQAGLDF